MTRKEFIAASAAFAAAPAFAKASAGKPAFARNPEGIRGVLLHMGMNMWGEWRAPDEPKIEGKRYTHDEIFFSEDIWRRTIDHAVKRRFNMVVMDLGEFVVYPSHPELAVKGSWSPDKMRAEVRRLKALGLEPIPKLNFSATHDQWLKQYHRMVSTEPYYRVCFDVIKDVCEIFETPRFLHIGFDEEQMEWQRKSAHVTCRQNELWWHSLYKFIGAVESHGVRPWMFSDYGWSHPEFIKKCPKSVLQCPGYYNEDVQGYVIEKMKKGYQPRLKIFIDLTRAGFDIVALPTNWVSPKLRASGRTENSDNAAEMVKFCRANVVPERLKGYLMAPWLECKTESSFRLNCAGMDQLADALDGTGA